MSLASKIGALFGTSTTVLDPALVGGSLPTGTVVPFAGSSAPTGWLLCYGQAVSRSTYSALFSAIGATHGAGDGSTTFGLPDLRGRIPAGKDDMGGSAAGRMTSAGGGVDGATLGASGGTETHTLTSGQMPSHTHSGTTVADGGHTPLSATEVASGGIGTGQRLATGTVTIGARTSTTTLIQAVPDHTHTFTTASAGTGSAHPNTQPSLVLNYIIKT